jgi:hypothetical protein
MCYCQLELTAILTPHIHIFDRTYSFYVPFYNLSDDIHVQVETYRRDVNDKWLYITDYAICWTKYCIKMWDS